MVAILSRAPAGFAGSISRPFTGQAIQQELINPSTPPTAYGQFLKYVGGYAVPLVTSDAGSVVAGMCVRSYPAQSTTNALGVAAPPTTGFIDMLRSGYIAALLALGTAAKGGAVYVVTTAGGTVNVGDIVTSAAPAGGGTGVLVPNAFFEGPADAGGIVEISYNV